MRNPGNNDYSVTVEGIGTFTFARRKLSDELRVQAEHSRIIDGVDQPTEWLHSLATWMATLRVLMVTGPAGWDLEELDPIEPETFEQISSVYAAMRAKENSFRKKSGKGSEGASQADVEDDRVLVSTEVQSTAE